MSEKVIYLVGYASGVAGVDGRVDEGPLVIRQSEWLASLNQQQSINWHAMISTEKLSSTSVTELVCQSCQLLAQEVSFLVKNKLPFTVLGGDHSAAIGTWSGVYDALHQQGELGLIWIDAHMDSHTPQTSESGRVHGMPLACLLGYGNASLTQLLHAAPKIQPENVCLIGVRSFERGEQALLERLGVRVYFMEEVQERGFAVVLNEAVKQVSANTAGYGISLDLDGIDPLEAPGVDVPEPDGIRVHDLLAGLSQVAADPHLIATEIVEFDPLRDKNKTTEKLIISILKQIHFG